MMLTRQTLLPKKAFWLLHGGNVVFSTVLFVLLWMDFPSWVRVPYAAFWGAILLNSTMAVLVRRDFDALGLSEDSPR